MMKVVIYFNLRFLSVNASQANQAVAQISNEEGVEAVRTFQATEGKPQYALEIECADDAFESVISQVNSRVNEAKAKYSAFITDVTVRTFRQLA